MSSGPLAQGFSPEKGWFRLKLNGPVTLSFKQAPRDSQHMMLELQGLGLEREVIEPVIELLVTE